MSLTTGSLEYPKINTLYKRDEKTHKIIVGDYSRPEFESIKKWSITEKIDGMNIRVAWNNFCDGLKGKPWFAGKTSNSHIPIELVKHLNMNFSEEKMKEQFKESNEVVLFGEGYGSGIQKGGKYQPVQTFILFDAWIDGWWLEPEKVKSLADDLGISYVPVWGNGPMCLDDAIELGMGGCSFLNCSVKREGIVARSSPLMLFRDGTPIMWKLKAKDFEK